MTVFLVIYALAGLIFFAFKRYSSGSIVDTNEFYGFSGHWMAFYSLALTLLYSCKCLKNDVH